MVTIHFYLCIYKVKYISKLTKKMNGCKIGLNYAVKKKKEEQRVIYPYHTIQ